MQYLRMHENNSLQCFCRAGLRALAGLGTHAGCLLLLLCFALVGQPLARLALRTCCALLSASTLGVKLSNMGF